MEDDIIFFENMRLPQFSVWKTTPIVSKDDLKFFENERRPQTFYSNGWQPKYFFELNDLNCFKLRMTSKKKVTKNN